jgi:hypothetical protein
MFGNIPLITSSQVVNTKQAQPADVYTLIANDLKFAIENLPVKKFSEISSTDLAMLPSGLPNL